MKLTTNPCTDQGIYLTAKIQLYHMDGQNIVIMSS